MDQLEQVKSQLFLQYQVTSEQTLVLAQVLETGKISELAVLTQA